MVLDFEYTKDEFVDSRRKFIFMRKLITKLQVAVFVFLGLVDIFFLCTKGVEVLKHPIMIVVNVLYILCTIMTCFLYFIQPGLMFHQTAKFHQIYHLEFLEDNIIFHTDNLHSEINWNIYTALWENKKYFYLLQTKDIYSLIPKRVFSTEEEVIEFRELYHRQLPSVEYRYFD